MTTYTIMLCTEPYKLEATDSLINISNAIIEKGHTIKGIFLFGSGVYNMKKDIEIGAANRNLPTRLEELCEKNDIPIIGCSAWLGVTGINKENFVKKSEDAGLGELSNWAFESEKLIVFGTGV